MMLENQGGDGDKNGYETFSKVHPSQDLLY